MRGQIANWPCALIVHPLNPVPDPANSVGVTWWETGGFNSHAGDAAAILAVIGCHPVGMTSASFTGLIFDIISIVEITNVLLSENTMNLFAWLLGMRSIKNKYGNAIN